VRWWHNIFADLSVRAGRLFSGWQTYGGLTRAPLSGLDAKSEGGFDTMCIGILVFSILAGAVTLLIFRKYETFEKAELSTYVALIAWGSLLFGLFMAKISY
jgi:hypothetical protein